MVGAARDAVRRVTRRVLGPRARARMAVVVVALLGAWLGLLAGGRVTQEVGPVETSMALRPATTGDTRVDIAPLGSLTLDSHDGVLGLQVAVRQIDVDAARAIVRDPTRLEGLQNRVVTGARQGVLRLAVQGAAAAALGAFVTGLVVLRRARRAAAAAVVALLALVGNAAVVAASWDPRALAQPRYSGLLASAPQVVGSAQSIVGNFALYRAELAKIVTNVSKLYDAASTLPTFSGDASTLRVLQVSDIHLNPAAFDVIRSVVRQYHVDLVIDSGDLTDHGTTAESRFADLIPTIGVPYVYVRGNHDSRNTQAAVARERGAVVLDGDVRVIDGLRIAGLGDPRYTPDRSVEAPDEALPTVGDTFAERLSTEDPEPDIVVVHDPTIARRLDGTAPLLLAGHTHRRTTEVLEQGSRLMVEGSTGGAGLRALEGDQPTPVSLTVLYLDRTSHRLQAWDEIQLGGLGLTSAEIQRRLASEEEASGATPTPQPTAG